MHRGIQRMSLAIGAVLLSTAAVSAESVIDYSRQIRPILSRNCFACHGPDDGTVAAGLRLDQREGATVQLESGNYAVVAGSPDQSEVMARIVSTDATVLMPPPESGKALSPVEIELLKKWIGQGARYSKHWAFEPVNQPAPPAVDPKVESRVRNEVDRFVFARLQTEGLSPSPEANPLTLIRRLSLDLTGLPPSGRDVEDFLSDRRPDAYERLVDRLLQSPHFGERWGRHWLDLARYADSDGYLGDNLRKDAFRYRDWVINAINEDEPYDRFTIEQIAGDLLPEATSEQKIATGLHRNAMKNTEAGADRELDRVVQAVDRVSTVGTVWLGLTVGCAECHSHKFDPISHHEFYSLFAFFNNLKDLDLKVGEVSPEKVDPEVRKRKEQELRKIAEQLASNESVMKAVAENSLAEFLKTLAQKPSDRSEPDREALEHWMADLDAAGRKLATRYETASQALTTATPILAPVIVEQPSAQRRKTFVHLRGDFRQPGDEVQPGTPAILPPLNPRAETADRLDLANWLVRRDHPLTSRTAVNHAWKHLLGHGLVETVDNFGVTGSEPTHPELLDWLAVYFMDSGWSRKSLIRKIVLSSTYRQSSFQSNQLRERDPENSLLARQGRWRVEGEVIRDLALSASGLLNRKVGGPSILPPMNSRITEVSRNQEWTVSAGDEKYRRGLYILFRRTTPFPMLTMFDSPDSTVSCPNRERSNSPLQALTLLNDPVFFECSQHLGRQLIGLGDVPDHEWIELAFERVLSRPAQSVEMQRLVKLAADQRALVSNLSREEVDKIIGEVQPGLHPNEQAVRVLVARTLMNLDEFITRE